MIFLILLATILTSAVTQFGNKKLQTVFPEGKTSYAIYAFITGIVSCVNYSILTQFNIIVNLRIILFSLFYAFVCRLAYLANFKSLRYHGIIISAAIGRVGSVFLPIVICAVFLNERQGLGTVIGGICVVIAAFLPGISLMKDKNNMCQKIVWGVITVAIGLSTTMLTKFVVAYDGTIGLLSFYLFTHLFVALTSAFTAFKEFMFRKNDAISELKAYKAPLLLLTLFITLSSSVGGYITKMLVDRIGVISSTVISAASAFLITALSAVYFKEKLTVKHVISIILSIVSIILPVVLL